MVDNWDAEKLGGSIKRKITNPDLIEERKNCAFNQEELLDFYFSGDTKIKAQLEQMSRILEQNPDIKSGFEYYEMSRAEKIEEWWRRYRIMFKDKETADLILNNSDNMNPKFFWSYYFLGTNPLHLHQTMFT